MSLVSVVIPSYRRPDMLRRCLKSVSSQEYRDFEVLVIDDCSPQQKEYAEVVGYFEKRCSLKYIRNSRNEGPQVGRNLGIREATGKYIAFVDDDDEWLPRKLEKQVAMLEAQGSAVGLIYSWVDAINDGDGCVHRYRSRLSGTDIRPLLESCFLPSPSVMVPRRVLLAVGGWDVALPSCQDWDLWTRIVYQGYSYAVVEEVLAIYHIHAQPRIGTSRTAAQGFKAYYGKHRDAYKRYGMARALSEKERWLASLMRTSGDFAGELEMLRHSIHDSPTNWKAWVQFARSRFGRVIA